jgi:5-methyltetrahydropteroyltriglutamate--homocysteine methyltransferase
MALEYRADHLGSFLRPSSVKDARTSVQAGRMSAQELQGIEDTAILEALERQKSIGFNIFSDGEFRRSGFQNDFMDSVEGFVATDRPVVRIWKGPGGDPKAQGTDNVVGATLKQARRLTGTQTAFLKAHASGPIKMTVPSPNQFPALVFQPGVTDKFYATRTDLLHEITSILIGEVAALIQEGVEYIQVDAPRYSYFVDPKWRQVLLDNGQDPEDALDQFIAADNAVLEGAQRDGAVAAIHLCRGNNQSKWYAEGGYEPLAEKVFNQLNVDRFLLEYDTDRSGNFEPLRFVPKGKVVVLGLVSTKDATMESQDDLLRRIDEAAKYMPMENLTLSPQCGFASMAAGNIMTEDQQWRKMELVLETAQKAWT